MESTREERLQMRQRGAGTRQIKAVDFGFSFGAPAPGPSGSAPISLFPEPETSQTQPVPAPSATPPSLKVSSQPEPQKISQSQRTPGSARNHLPRRPSTYDIPSDERHEVPRSNKRRRLKTQSDAIEAPSLPEESVNNEVETDGGARTFNPDSTAQAVSEEQNQSTTQDLTPAVTTETINQTSPRGSRSPKDTIHETPPIVDPTDLSSTRQRNSRSPSQAEESPAEGRGEQQTTEKPNPSTSSQGPRKPKTRIPRARSTTTDASDTNQSDRGHTETAPNNVGATEIATETATVTQNLSDTTKKTQGRKDRTENGERAPAQTVNETVLEAEVEPQPKIAQIKPPSKDKRPRGRPSLSGKKHDKEAQNEQGLKRPLEAGTDTEPGPSKPRRGRPSLSGKQVDKKAQAGPETEPEAESGPSKPRRGRPAKNKPVTEPESAVLENQTNPETEPQPEPDQEDEPEISKPRRGRPAKNKPATQPEPVVLEDQMSPETEPQPELEQEAVLGSKSRRGRPRKKSKVAAESEPTAPEEQPNIESEPRSEPEQEDEPLPSKARRGRTKKNRAVSEPESTTREGEADTETVEERRKPREPRGETVPVTVHRLFNPSALGAMYASAGSGEEDEESADELSTRQKTKLPNRGGVNPADVLSQICRETLEKTLTALKNGIANETNTQRRAEWTRKRRAVEAFGSELDGRLLDLSEMLDSNFVLGVQLRKTKREMMDLRSHLYKVRRERESIALQMDAVRSKHMEEENTKTSRTTINNSLHSLELALDRNQQQASSTTDPSPADLEFMLRTVAEDVSSRAPGAQGGLLNQIRSFNDQLETTARLLER
ncbi:hypothetical protein N7494_010957 [Penicillium frequentans]|uniref:Inner kinetochore subunit AME1 domain-containing protein n=1 Tax=Penicillium frequentans TaxID=3151616 RepID=A0AAD6CIR2_9EURO|nr:hypothetical protein N7494_010957 [Penicillium glabrum]